MQRDTLERLLVLGGAIALILLAHGAHAATTKAGFVACSTEEHFSEFSSAFVAKDEEAIRFLLDPEDGFCAMLPAGIHATVLHRGWTGQIKVRLYGKGGAFDAWTYMEAVQP